MTTIPNRSVEAFIRKPESFQPVILVYGPDTGLVSERVKALMASAVDNADDPFQLVTIDGDTIADDPARLADEAYTIPMFGGRRAIRVRAGTRAILAGVEPLLKGPPKDCRVVIEGGDWKKTHALVKLLDESRGAAVIACYGDESTTVAEIVAQEVASAGLSIAPSAREALVALLGGDRLASRGEIRKLCLYCLGTGRIEVKDVEAVVGDATELVQDEVVDAAFLGRVEELDPLVAKAWAEGIHASVLAGAALRHALVLHRLRGEVDKGRPAEGVVASLGGMINFKRKDGAARSLQRLSSQALERITQDLADAVFEARRNATLGPSIVSRALMRVALLAKR